MSTLTYPFTLTAGQPENVNQLNSNLSAIRTLLNGSVDGVNAPTFGQNYRTIAQAHARFNGGFVAGLYHPTGSGTAQVSGSTTTTATGFNIDPADYAITGMSTKYRIRVLTVVNNTAPAINYTFGLHVISSVAGAAGNLAYTLNPTAVTSSTVTLTTPSSSTGNSSVSSAFSAPASGFYSFGITSSGTQSGNSEVAFSLLLQAVNS